MNILGKEGHAIVVDEDLEARLLAAYPKANSVEKLWNPISKTWNTIVNMPQGISRQVRAMRAEFKRSQKESRMKVNHHRQEMIHRGAAKILGLTASHIYASKPQ